MTTRTLIAAAIASFAIAGIVPAVAQTTMSPQHNAQTMAKPTTAAAYVATAQQSDLF
jgi:hypothetical protein